MINSKYNKGIQAANVLLSLRLGGFLSQSQDQQLIEKVLLATRSTGEYLYSLEDLGKDLPIHKDYLQQQNLDKILCPKSPCYIYPSCIKLEGTERYLTSSHLCHLFYS